jgi:hypothetical protein
MSEDERDELSRLMLPNNGVPPSQAMKSISNLLRSHQIGITGKGRKTARIQDHLHHYACATELDIVVFPGRNMGAIESTFKITHAESMLFESEINEEGEMAGHQMGEFVNCDKLSFSESKDWIEMFLDKPENIMHRNIDPSQQIYVNTNYGKQLSEIPYASTLIVWGLESGFFKPQEVSDQCKALINLEGFDLMHSGDLYCFSKLAFCQAGAMKQLKYVGAHKGKREKLESQLMELLSGLLGELPEPVTDEELEEMKEALDDDNEQNKDTRRGKLAYLHFSLE